MAYTILVKDKSIKDSTTDRYVYLLDKTTSKPVSYASKNLLQAAVVETLKTYSAEEIIAVDKYDPNIMVTLV